MADKDWRGMVNQLAETVDEIVFTRVGMERSAEPRKLAECLEKDVPRRVVDDARKGIDLLLDGAEDNDIILVAGSLYLVGEIRPAVRSALAQRMTGTKNSCI